MSEHMSSQNPLLPLTLMGQDKSRERERERESEREREVDTTSLNTFILVKNCVFWLQAALAEASKQKQFWSLNAISGLFTEQYIFLLKQDSS